MGEWILSGADVYDVLLRYLVATANCQHLGLISYEAQIQYDPCYFLLLYELMKWTILFSPRI